MPGATALSIGSETAFYFTVAAWICHHEVTLIYEEPLMFQGAFQSLQGFFDGRFLKQDLLFSDDYSLSLGHVRIGQAFD